MCPCVSIGVGLATSTLARYPLPAKPPNLSKVAAQQAVVSSDVLQCLVPDLAICKARFLFSSRLCLPRALSHVPKSGIQEPSRAPAIPTSKKSLVWDFGFQISNFDFCKGQAFGVASPIPLSPVVCQTMLTFLPPTPPFCITVPLLRV